MFQICLQFDTLISEYNVYAFIEGDEISNKTMLYQALFGHLN
jgi:hypothetical protein